MNSELIKLKNALLLLLWLRCTIPFSDPYRWKEELLCWALYLLPPPQLQSTKVLKGHWIAVFLFRQNKAINARQFLTKFQRNLTKKEQSKRWQQRPMFSNKYSKKSLYHQYRGPKMVFAWYQAPILPTKDSRFDQGRDCVSSTFSRNY